MSFEIVIIFLLITCSIFITIFLFGIFSYDKTNKRKTLGKKDEDDWLLSDAGPFLYKLFYGKAESETLLGINKREFERYCKLLHITPEYEKYVIYRIEGGLTILAGATIAYSLLNHGQSLIGLIIIIIAIGFFYMRWVAPYSAIKNSAEEKIFRVQNEFPRYLTLLEKALDLPVDQAMLLTAQRFPSPLSDDIIDSINKVSLGAEGWSSTLIELARLYDIEDFSSFVLDIINGYEQGLNIRHLVERKINDVEQSRMYAVEAHDAKMKNMIFFPVIVLKVIPLMVLICLPLVSDFI